MTPDQRSSFSFLLSGPRLSVSLPSDFNLLPQLSSPIDIGRGGRSYVFSPLHLELDLASRNRLVQALIGKDGRLVEVYERIGTPLIWFLRWPLANGSLVTHLADEDGLERAQVVADSLTMVEDARGGTPFLLPEPPLRSAVSSHPGWQEKAVFFGQAENWGVFIHRPGFIPEGRRLRMPEQSSGAIVWLRAGAPHGMEVQITSDTDAQGGEALLEAILSSLAEDETA